MDECCDSSGTLCFLEWASCPLCASCLQRTVFRDMSGSSNTLFVMFLDFSTTWPMGTPPHVPCHVESQSLFSCGLQQRPPPTRRNFGPHLKQHPMMCRRGTRGTIPCANTDLCLDKVGSCGSELMPKKSAACAPPFFFVHFHSSQDETRAFVASVNVSAPNQTRTVRLLFERGCGACKRIPHSVRHIFHTHDHKGHLSVSLSPRCLCQSLHTLIFSY